MRPLGEVAQALLATANRLSAAGRSVTLAEMAEAASVGKAAANVAVKSLRKRGQLRIVGQRRVSYRNRPVAEYAPATPPEPDAVIGGTGMAELCQCMSAWARQAGA